MPKLEIMWTDGFVWLMVAMALGYVWHVLRTPALRQAWRSVFYTPSAVACGVVLSFFVVVGLLDSIHYRPVLPAIEAQTEPRYSPISRSVLDDVLELAGIAKKERSYSAPLSTHLFFKESMIFEGEVKRDFPALENAALNVTTAPEHTRQLWRLSLWALGSCAVIALALGLSCRAGARRHPNFPWKSLWVSLTLLLSVLVTIYIFSRFYYLLGTDRSGNDVLFQCFKSIRTALVIGTLTTLAMLPPALIFGIAAGYFKGWVDDVIQYIYTTLTSIPGVLLIAACVLMMQVYIERHADLFDTIAARADLRLLVLCLILGFTGWAGLCRLLRAEVLKLRELEYVQAARAFGVGSWGIMTRHLLPNVMHLVLITMVLEFSGLVLYEAVLSYLGIGVDPSMPSFGTMIDAARLEMSRDPMIWWNLVGAFFFLLTLVLAANIFSDAVQRAFDPRVRRIEGQGVRHA